MKGNAPRHGLARALSKRGVCSRAQACVHVREGRVRVNGRLVRDPEFPTIADDVIELDGLSAVRGQRRVFALNKPRGVVTTRSDEKGRKTVYDLLPADMPWLAPVGRLDQASEGLLLFTNDPECAARLTDPATHVSKIYHVQIDCVPDAALLRSWREGVVEHGETLRFSDARLLRRGERNAWIEVVLLEGRNRHIRRVMAACHIAVLRLMRVAIGSLPLGDLGKGAFRELRDIEIEQLFAPPVLATEDHSLTM